MTSIKFPLFVFIRIKGYLDRRDLGERGGPSLHFDQSFLDKVSLSSLYSAYLKTRSYH